MSSTARGIHHHPTLKLGRAIDAPEDRPKLDITDLAVAADWGDLPATADYGSGGGWLMLGNGPDPLMGPSFTGAGNCEAVRWANTRRLITGAYPGATPADTLGMVWTVYETQAKGFDPNGDPSTDGPGSPKDTGMSTAVLLDDLHKNGGPDGVEVVCYASIDPTNIVAVQRAIDIFHAVWIDVLVQDGNQQEFSEGQPWTDTGQEPEGGHAITGSGQVPQRKALTWAEEIELADSYWNGVVGKYRLVEGVYVPIFPEHFTDAFLGSDGLAQMAARYKALTGKTLVTPTPIPVTPPAPAPTPAPADAAAALVEVGTPWVAERHDGETAKVAEALKAWIATQ